MLACLLAGLLACLFAAAVAAPAAAAAIAAISDSMSFCHIMLCYVLACLLAACCLSGPSVAVVCAVSRQECRRCPCREEGEKGQEEVSDEDAVRRRSRLPVCHCGS